MINEDSGWQEVESQAQGHKTVGGNHGKDRIVGAPPQWSGHAQEVHGSQRQREEPNAIRDECGRISQLEWNARLLHTLNRCSSRHDGQAGQADPGPQVLTLAAAIEEQEQGDDAYRAASGGEQY